MWQLLDAYTIGSNGEQRPVNHQNEWGGFSKKLNLPVFTSWFDFAKYDTETKVTKSLILDEDWDRPVGKKNQNYWIDQAKTCHDGIGACFIIHPVDPAAVPRKVRSIESDRIFVGKIVREGSKTYILGSPKPL
jgi:hypothetical protein